MEAINMMREFRRPIDTIVHVGFSNGLDSRSYLSSGANDVMYVEPIPAVFNELCSQISQMPGHIAVNALCADQDGRFAQISAEKNSKERSIIFELVDNNNLHSSIKRTDLIEMRTTTLDSICEQYQVFNNVSLLVLNAHGAATLILRGASETLKNTSAVYCDFSDIRLYESGCVWRELMDVLGIYGFKLKCFRLGANHYGNAFLIKEDATFESNKLEHGINVALHKVAKQSSLSNWSTPGEAVNAVNGQKSGCYAFHTEKEIRPWWQVDLGKVILIDHIVIFNRLDACARRAYTLQVLIGNALHDLAVIHSQDGQPFGGFGGQPLTVGVNGRAARYVRIQLQGEGVLHLDEVEVYGPASA